MRILSINLFTQNNVKGSIGNNQIDYYRNKAFIEQNDTFVKSKTEPAFNGIKTMREFRNLAKIREIHCIYCKKPMINVEVLEDLRNRGVFSGPVKKFIKETAKYKHYLKEPILQAYQQIERIAKDAPNTHLSRIIRILHQESLQSIRKIQNPIFDKIEAEIKNIHPKYRKEFKSVMELNRKRLNGIPHKEDFDAKDFIYKLDRLTETVSQNRLKKNITTLTQPLKKPSFENLSYILPDNIIKKIFGNSTDLNYNMPVSVKSIQMYIVEEIKKIGAKLGRDDIVNLCRNSARMILNKPAIVPFRNKAFSHELDEILKKGASENVHKRIKNYVKKLPTSDSNTNSFIAKHKYSDSDTIGYFMFQPSRCTLEHITPASTRLSFVNKIGNWALACETDNNKRLNKSMEMFLQKFDPANPQVYFDDIINAANERIIDLEDLYQMKESIYREGNKQLNLSKLSNEVLIETFKNNPQEEFDKFVELANKQLISGHDIYQLQKILRKRFGINVEINNLKYLFY